MPRFLSFPTVLCTSSENSGEHAHLRTPTWALVARISNNNQILKHLKHELFLYSHCYTCLPIMVWRSSIENMSIFFIPLHIHNKCVNNTDLYQNK